MEDSRIADNQITASSEYNSYHASNARLNSPSPAWFPTTDDLTPWIQVDLGVAKKVSGVVLQGRQDGDQWVTHYKVQYGNGSSTLLMSATPMISQYQDKLVSHTLHSQQFCDFVMGNWVGKW